jgi:uncharacterized protein YaeQ
MALPSTRMEYRISLNQVDRGFERAETVILALHPSETLEHLTLRVLAWCLFCEEGLAFGPGLSTPDAPDLWTHDLTGRLTTWIECGSASGDKLKKVVQHNNGARVHAVFSDVRRRDELLAELGDWKRAGEIGLWTVDAQLVRELAARDERRHKWTVTYVGDHFYVEADGRALDGAVTRG